MIITIIILILIHLLIFMKIISNRDALLQSIEEFPTLVTMQNGPSIGIQLPPFKLITQDGNEKELSQIYSQRNTIMLIAADYCDVCGIDVMEFIQFSKVYPEYNFLLIIDYKNSEHKKIITSSNLEMLYANKEFLHTYDIKLFPTFLFINKQGIVVATPQVVSQFKEILNNLVKNNKQNQRMHGAM